MLIVPSKKLVMLLPWKTASQTLRARLKPINETPYPFIFYFNPFLNRVVHQHAILSDYLALPESALGYDLAVFARNPYDRVFSGFQQILRDIGQHPKIHYPNVWMKDLIVEQIGDLFESLAKAQFNVNSWFQDISPYYILESGRNICLCLHPVHYWTHYKGKQLTQFVGKVEHFEEDFSALCARYKIENSRSHNVNQSDTKFSMPDAHGYKYASHLEPKTIAKINELFHEDFAYFGYEKIRV